MGTHPHPHSKKITTYHSCLGIGPWPRYSAYTEYHTCQQYISTVLVARQSMRLRMLVALTNYTIKWWARTLDACACRKDRQRLFCRGPG